MTVLSTNTKFNQPLQSLKCGSIWTQYTKGRTGAHFEGMQEYL